MKAQLIQQEAPGGKRTPLCDVLPLDTPFLVQIFPIYACNFRCKYCHFSIPVNERKFVSDVISMDFELYKKIIDELQEFPAKIRTLRFVGMGEPLLHKDIARMIKYAQEKNIANRLELLTNGSLLMRVLSDRLIDSGLDRLVISLQGTNADKYHKTSCVNLDFEQFVNNIKYFYNNKKNIDVYCKIIDCSLENEDDKEKFFDLFGNICDSIGIENAVPIFVGVQYNHELETLQNNKYKTQFGLEIGYMNICPQPFYSLQINPDGKVVGCHSIYYPEIFGDCNNTMITDIWNNTAYNNFRFRMLGGRESVCDICKNCNIMNQRFFPEDDISSVSQKLMEYYKNRTK
jgi:radical SAM protein with 4Fe4S-binding SPASM domain